VSETHFSDELEAWLKSDKPKSLAGINDVFAEKSFAVIFLILMSFPALPIPTGGITHVFEIIVMLLSLELIIGRRTIWIPRKWENTKIGKRTKQKIMPFILKRVKWFEKYSTTSNSKLLQKTNSLRIIGLIVFIFTLAAFLSPPFTGLDTLPSLGVVIIALALLFNDFKLIVSGIVVGILGIVVSIGFGKIVISLTQKLFHL
jgi:hypothetical protein